ncbi:MAG: RHS repeat protein [Lentisphaeria bacterium]|nr:RHS repeat protein [Lentisphaeria bacterium]
MNKIIPTPSYTYNKANQLVTSTVNGVTTHYKYDAAGRMIQAGDKTYIYNGQNKTRQYLACKMES